MLTQKVGTTSSSSGPARRELIQPIKENMRREDIHYIRDVTVRLKVIREGVPAFVAYEKGEVVQRFLLEERAAVDSDGKGQI